MRGKLAMTLPRKALGAAEKLRAAMLEGSTDSEDQKEEEVLFVESTQPEFVCVTDLEDQKEETVVFVESSPPEVAFATAPP